MVHRLQPSIIAIQEIYNVSLERLNRSLGGNYTWNIKVQNRQNNLYHSIAVGVRKPAICVEITTDTDLPVLAVRIQGNKPVTVVCFYLPAGRKLDLKAGMNNTLAAISGPALLLGDANAHHYAWGSQNSSRRGKELLAIS